MFGLTRAPDFDRAGLAWLNVSAPLRLSDLGGRLTIVDFWTYCCINCMHVVPTLRRIELAFPEEVAVVGVHSPKFTAERDPANLAHAIARYDIRHPIVHDPGFALWQEYGVRAWPTLVLIGPDGRVIGHLAGEPSPDRLFHGIGNMVREWRRMGMLTPRRLPVSPAVETAAPLRFPGKIKPVRGADGRQWWAVADSGHHQVVVFDDEGREVRRFGCGRPGLIDADAASSAFDSPQGLVSGGGGLFVADTGNHAIRRIDLAEGTTMTLAGTGQRGTLLEGPESAVATDLASPWDLETAGDAIFFANAGTHQLGVLRLEAGTVARLAGSGIEGLADGPAAEAELAQPSGLAVSPDGNALFFVDAETSAVRRLTFGCSPRVDTLVGAGLFDFGHINGSFVAARMQHPLGLAWHDGGLVVADSYNACLRKLDPVACTVGDLDAGEGFQAGEPAGVVSAGPGRVLMTDTNHHRIIEVLTGERRSRVWAG